VINYDFFDYATIMLRMDKLNKDIHQDLLNHKYADARAKSQELLFQTRLLNLWIAQEIERTNGHSNH
jgi:hypothetical protein